MATATNSPTDFVELNKQRTAEQRRREREQVDAAVASELDLVLRGLPHSESVLRYARGELASLRDVLVVAEPGELRRRAAVDWLNDAGDELNARWAAYELVMASRDPRREAIRRERAFFAKTAAQPALADDAGDLPPLPKHNPQKFITTLKTRQTAAANEEWVFLHPMVRARKDDPSQLGKDAWRLAKQIEEEQQDGRTLYLVELEKEDDWRRLRDTWRKRRERGAAVAWQVYRLDGGRVAVIHDDERRAGDELPSDAAELKTTTKRLLMNAPAEEVRRVRTSPGFGGSYQGSRGDGRAKQAARDGSNEWKVRGQFATEGPGGIQRAAGLVGIVLNDKLRGGVQVHHEDALLALAEGGFTMRPRSSHKDALSIFDFILDSGEGMSHLASTTEERVDAKCDILPDEARQDFLLVDEEPPDDWRRTAKPAPIYLSGGAIW